MEARGFRIMLLVLRTRRSSRLFEEIGVCHLAAYLRQSGYEVRLTEESEESMDVAGMREFPPDLMGLPVYANIEKAAVQACRRLKETVPEARLCLGGYSPTSRGNRMMERRRRSIRHPRRGRAALQELADRLSRGENLEGLRGLSFRGDGVVRHNGDRVKLEELGSLPWPARDFLRHQAVRGGDAFHLAGVHPELQLLLEPGGLGTMAGPGPAGRRGRDRGYRNRWNIRNFSSWIAVSRNPGPPTTGSSAWRKRSSAAGWLSLTARTSGRISTSAPRPPCWNSPEIPGWSGP